MSRRTLTELCERNTRTLDGYIDDVLSCDRQRIGVVCNNLMEIQFSTFAVSCGVLRNESHAWRSEQGRIDWLSSILGEIPDEFAEQHRAIMAEARRIATKTRDSMDGIRDLLASMIEGRTSIGEGIVFVKAAIIDSSSAWRKIAKKIYSATNLIPPDDLWGLAKPELE